MAETKQERLIGEALKTAISKGVKITRRPIFDWGRETSQFPESCNAIGAVLIHLNLHHLLYPDFSPGWQRHVENYLGVDESWINRFCLGWCVGYQVQIRIEKGGKEVFIQDEISALGLRMRP